MGTLVGELCLIRKLTSEAMMSCWLPILLVIPKRLQRFLSDMNLGITPSRQREFLVIKN
jgi:hypothetical protein